MVPIRPTWDPSSNQFDGKGDKNPSCKTRGLAAMIYFSGLRNGRVIIDMELPTALAIAGQMNGAFFNEANKLVHASIAEFTNVIVCRAICELHEAGHAFSISPPTVLEGQEMTLSTPALIPMFLTEFKNSLGTILINLAFVEE